MSLAVTRCRTVSQTQTLVQTLVRRRHWSGNARLALLRKHALRCHICWGEIHIGEAWEVSHEIALKLGGADDDMNAKPAHRKCHRRITSEQDIPAIARAKRREANHLGAKRSRRPMPGSRASGWRKKMDGTVERR